MAGEGLHTLDAGQLRPMQRPVGHAHEASSQLVTAVRGHQPTTRVIVPAQFTDLGLEQRALVQPEVPTDGPAVLQDLRRPGVLLRGDVPDLLEQRKVDVRLDVAHRARVTVPVPRSAEVAGLLDDPHIADPGLLQPGRRKLTAETTADHHDVDLVEHGVALDLLDVRVVDVVSKSIDDLEVLLVAVGAQTLVPFGAVLLPERIGIERQTVGRHHPIVAGTPERCVVGGSSARRFDRVLQPPIGSG